MKRINVLAVFYVATLVVATVACNRQISATPHFQEAPTQFSILPMQSSFMLTNTLTPLPPLAATRFASFMAIDTTSTANAQFAMNDCNGFLPTKWYVHADDYSPSGKWRIVYCRNADTNHNYAKVINTENGVVWNVYYVDQGKFSGGSMELGFWSKDEKYAYFEKNFCCIDGPGMIFFAGFGRYRLDLHNGDLKEINKGTLSPDQQYSVFYDYNNSKIVIDNLITEQNISFGFTNQFEGVGVFVWSPDNKKIVFSAAVTKWYEIGSGFVMYLIDLNKNTIKPILHDPPSNYIAIKWLPEEKLLIENYNWPQEFVFDIKTKKIVPIDSISLTLTPSP